VARVGVFHSWGMGDLILLTPTLRSLHLSGHRVELILTSDYTPLLRGADFVEKIWVVKRWWELGKFFRKFDYLVGSAGISPSKLRWLGKIWGVKRVLGGRQIPNLHRIEVNLKIAEPLLKEKNWEPYIYIAPKDKVSHYLKKGVKNIGFGVGSGKLQKFKRWKRFGELIERVEGHKLIFIGPDEVELEEGFRNLGEIVKVELGALPVLISQLDLLVGNDNGIMQIGYGVGTNCVTIFGMTNPRETGGYRPNNLSVYLPLPCRPCFDPSTDRVGCTRYPCLTQLSPEKVLEKCQKFL